MKRKKKRKTTIGSRRLLWSFICLVFCVLALSGKDKKKGQQVEPQAVIAGTVFNTNGFALGGADVVVVAVPKDIKELKTVANDRGEFAVRVPAVPKKYRIDVKMKGFQSQTKDVQIEGEQRKELNFLLEAAK
jgi:hypothetical protein